MLVRRGTTAFVALCSLWACSDDGGTGPTQEVGPPSVLSIEPATGTVGTEVRIEGSDFTAGVTVLFGNLEAHRVIQQGGALFVVAPEGLVAGQTNRVWVLNEGVAPDTAGFTFTAVPPAVRSVNGATRPEGLRGMTLIIEGHAFSDSMSLSGAEVFFEGAGGVPIPAPIADTIRDWTDRFIVTQVPQEIPDTTRVWVETPTGISDPVEFRVIQSGLFSPSNINWALGTGLPIALHALDAAFVAIEDGPSPANYIYTAGGIDVSGDPVGWVRRVEADQSGAQGYAWEIQTALPEARAYHRLVAATPLNAPVDTSRAGGFLYMLGGMDPDGATSASAWVSEVGLDGSLLSWESVTALPKALHSAGAAVFGGYVWLVGGSESSGQPSSSAYRSKIEEDGTLGVWSETASLPQPVSFGSLVGFGPFLYSVGGETGAVDPMSADGSGTETSQVVMARIDLRTRDLDSSGWVATEAMGKARSKHDAVFAGGALFVSSGIYNGQPGSSENTFASINSDGTLTPWQGATGSETIDVELGWSLYNHTMVSFVDPSGVGHVLVIGGADRDQAGWPSGAVLWY